MSTAFEGAELGEGANKSEIFVFKVSSFENLLDDSLNEDPYKDVLQSLLGYQYQELFNNDGELRNFKVQNNTVILNNEVVPISTLYDIIEKLNSGEIQLLEVEIE